MNYHKKNKLKRNILLGVIAAVCIFTFVVSFGDGKNTLSWDNIYNYFGLSPHVDTDSDFVKIIDVGQGDSILFYSDGKSALLDTGPAESSKALCTKLNSYGIKKFNALLITHLHMDHVGGLNDVIDRFGTANLVLPDLLNKEEGTVAVTTAESTVKKTKGGVYTAKQGIHMNVGEIEITLLAYYPDLSDENDRSVIMMARIDDIKFLMMGDAETTAENKLLDEGLNLSCDVLKVGHHGSSSSTGEKLVKACNPEYAAISCGIGNQYSHPHESTLETLEKYSVDIYRTDMNGDITFYVDDGVLTVGTEK